MQADIKALQPLRHLSPGNARSWRVHARSVALVMSLLPCVLIGCTPGPPDGGVHVLTVDGTVNPVVANYVERGVTDAAEGGADVVVIRLNTPGGLDSSMREIVQHILTSETPVVVYVWPSGGRAASAGTFITMAAPIAAMAPATAIGAAHPVTASGGDIPGDDLRTKAENDAVAYIRGVAESRGRNADWAEAAVRDSTSASTAEAVALGVVDLTAVDLDELLAGIEGESVTLASGAEVALRILDDPVHLNDMSLAERFLMQISDPNIAFLLLSLGSLALILELYSPSGIGLVVGAVALAVAFFSLGTLPVNWAGVALIMVAIALVVAELFVVSGGVLALVGAATLALGAVFLTTSNQPGFEVSKWLALGLPAAFGACFAALALVLIRLRRRGVSIGREALVGRSSVAVARVAPAEPGYVMVEGERWRAQLEPTEDAAILPGERAVVTSLDGLLLTIRPAHESDGGPGMTNRDQERKDRTESSQ